MATYKVLSNMSEVNMDDEWFEYTDSEHFWMKARFSVFQDMLGIISKKFSRGLEVGCGVGSFKNNAEELLNIPIDGVDLNEEALKKASDGRGSYYLHDINDSESSLENKYDIIFLMDVVEHIEDDIGFLKSVKKFCTKDALIVINVPAYQLLFSKYDSLVGHQRRYSRSELSNIISKSGFELVDMSSWGLLYIPILILRKILFLFVNTDDIIEKGISPSNKIIEQILILLFKAERSIPIELPLGTSIMVVAKLTKT